MNEPREELQQRSPEQFLAAISSGQTELPPGAAFEALLRDRLLPAVNQRRRTQLAARLAVWWICFAALVLVFALVRRDHHFSPTWILLFAAAGFGGAALIYGWQRRKRADLHDVARQIELRHPKLNGLLLTAIQQESSKSGKLNYFQQRIVEQALEHGRENPWSESITWRIAGAHLANVFALVLFVLALAGLRGGTHGKSLFSGWTRGGVTITPGDTSIERGERLVVIATFEDSVPAEVNLVAASQSGKPKRIPLVKSLSDPVFGGSISEVNTDLVYHVEYNARQSRDFTVKVFEYPRLERADADLTFPDYTGLAPKRIENTHRISAVEGTRCDLTLQLNKPVARAQFFVKSETNEVIPLVLTTNSPIVLLSGLALETNRTYLLQLVDSDGRTNKSPDQFIVDVLKNREPELKIASPRGDTRPSALEEVTFEGTVWDDFGVQTYGLAYAEAGGEPKFIELGKSIPVNEKRTFKHVLRLEDLGAKPDQLITWFLWADDTGPDGQIRRSFGNMYFAEVRPFDEVFRQGQGGGGGGGGSGRDGDGGGRQLTELQKQIISATWRLQRDQSKRTLQKKESKPDSNSGKTSFISPIRDSGPAVQLSSRLSTPTVNSFFAQPAPGNFPSRPPVSELERAQENLSKVSTNKTATTSQYEDDLKVVSDAIDHAIDQARERRGDGPRDAVLWDNAIREMQKAKAALEKAAQSPQSLADALSAERAAFQALLRLQQREYEISRNRNQNAGGRQQQMQRELDQLDLTDPENRYENERLANSPQSPERRSQLQVMNRLSELARRQQDLNNRLKELQTALQEARTEQEREEARRQLKRLQEEEQRMLADVDELQQRMNQPENQSRMTEQRQQLEQTRQEIQRASEAAQQGSPSQALASGTRAQRQLQEMREELRRQNSSEFADDLRQLRSDAREAERRQQEVQKQMDSLSGNGQKSLDDSQERKEALQQLEQQTLRLTNLVDRAAQLSQQTEQAEPLASRELYDTLRKFSQEDANSVREFQDLLIQSGLVQTELYRRLGQLAKEDGAKFPEVTSEMLRQGLLPQARQANNRASAAVSDLKRGIERAAEKVLGDDTEALRLAQQELDKLSGQVEREIAQQSRKAGRGRTNGQAQGVGGRSQQAQNNSQSGGSEQQETGSTESRPTQQEGQQGGGQQAEDGQAGQGGGSQRGVSTRGQGGRGPAKRDSLTGGVGGNAEDGSGLPAGLESFLNSGRNGNGDGNGPIITGNNFVQWSDRLREVEEMVEDVSLQNQIAAARERARLLRQEYRRTLEKPEWTLVRSQVVKPLVEVRNQIAEELARRGSHEELVPIDRDPVPSRYSELVRKYYEELGK